VVACAVGHQPRARRRPQPACHPARQSASTGRSQRTDLVSLTGLTAPAVANITKRSCRRSDQRRRPSARRPWSAACQACNQSDGRFSVGIMSDRDHNYLAGAGFRRGRLRSRLRAKSASRCLQRSKASFAADRPPARRRQSGCKQLVEAVSPVRRIQRAELPDQPPAYSAWGSVAIDRLLSGACLPRSCGERRRRSRNGEMQFGRGRSTRASSTS